MVRLGRRRYERICAACEGLRFDVCSGPKLREERERPGLSTMLVEWRDHA